MKKYLTIAHLTWDEILIYRFNFVMWRFRVVLQLITVYFLWLAVLPENTVLFGYNQSLMLTYILGASLIGSIVLSSKSNAIGDEINQGNLSNLLLRPVDYFKYWFARDIGDKAMNIIFSIGELIIFFLLLKPPIFLQTDIFYLSLTILATIVGIILFFLFNFLIGFIAFWSPEVWGPRFIFYIFLNFFAGGLFPLDILPKQIFAFFQILPFSYLLYFPLKIYLGQLNYSQVYTGLIISFVWIFILYFAVKFVWIKGLKEYTAQGR